MNIQSAVLEGTNILKDEYILTAQLDTEVLMAKVLGKSREYIILNNNKNLENNNLEYFKKLIKERATRKPIAYLLNKKFFWNNDFFVNKDTLIPRPDTEVVIEQILKLTKHKNKAKGMKILRSRLYELERSRIDQERSQDRKTKIGTGDRSERIRTYNFPQGRVTDHRINLTLHRLEEFLEGEAFDEMIESLTLQAQEDSLSSLN